MSSPALIAGLPGLGGIVFVGPNDLLSSMHKTPVMETDDPQFVAALKKIRETAVKYGIAPGIHVADSAAANRRKAEGWQFIAISSELGFMLQASADAVKATIGDPTGDVGRARY